MSLAAVQSDVLLSLRRRQNIYINVCVSGVTVIERNDAVDLSP